MTSLIGIEIQFEMVPTSSYFSTELVTSFTVSVQSCQVLVVPLLCNWRQILSSVHVQNLIHSRCRFNLQHLSLWPSQISHTLKDHYHINNFVEKSSPVGKSPSTHPSWCHVQKKALNQNNCISPVQLWCPNIKWMSAEAARIFNTVLKFTYEVVLIVKMSFTTFFKEVVGR